MGKMLITGANEETALAALERLLERGADVAVAVEDPTDAEAVGELGAEARLLDFEDQESVLAAMQGVERLLLLLPLHPDMRRRGSQLVQAARGAGVGTVVRVSAMGADGNAHYQLGKVHGGVDEEIETAGLRFVVLRAAPLMQSYLLLAPYLREHGVIPAPDGKGRSSFVDARDVGACAAEAMLRPEEFEGAVSVVTGPEALDNYQVAEILSSAAGRDIAYREGDIEETGAFLESLGMHEWCVHMALSAHRYARNGYTGFVTSAVEHMTGSPAKSFEQFAREHAEAWK